jgi:HEAT repeats
MPSRTTPAIATPRSSRPSRFMRLGLLALPCFLLTVAALRSSADEAGFLWLGAAVELIACGLALASGPGWRGSADLAVIVLYVTGVCWLIGTGPSPEDWYRHVAQAVLLVVPLCCFGAKFLRESGAPALRQARVQASKLTSRTEWPAELADCRLLPDVAALRDSLRIDASPALGMLTDPRPQIRLVALAALEYREHWRPGQAEMVLQLAHKAVEPEIRAATIRALGTVDDREFIEGLSEFLYDSSHRVRQAAVEVLLNNHEASWAWFRPALRRALADPLCQNDGPLQSEQSDLSGEAVNDLTAWASEKGILGLRAAQTLGAHYKQQLTAAPGPGLVAQLQKKLEDVHTPAMLRLELARLLHQHKALDAPLLRQLVSPATPAPLRLLAVEALLGCGESGQAVAALHDLARLPNREIALAVAEVAQRRLGVNFGLVLDQPPPPVQSRLAAEVARRVLAWASHQETDTEPPSEVGSGTVDHI